jgi:hypothetical protein
MVSPGLCALLACCLMFANAVKADVHFGNVSDEHCDLRIEGEITTDDVAVFRELSDRLIRQARSRYDLRSEFVVENWPHTVCLNSPGGSFLAGVEIAIMVQGYFETRLEPNASCFSACAIIFMAGSADHPGGLFAQPNPEEAGYGFRMQPRRIMSPSSMLGFHAPYINYGGRELVSVDEAQSALLGALSLTSFLLEATQRNYPLALAVEAMSRGPDEMFIVDEVGQLNAWNIGLDSDVDLSLSREHFQTAWITFAHQYANGRPGYGSVGDPAFGTMDNLPELWPTSGWDYNMTEARTPNGAPYLLATNIGNEASFGAAFIHYGDQFQLRVLSTDFSQEFARYDISDWQLLHPRTSIETLQ